MQNSQITINGSSLGNGLSEILLSDELMPGDDASYQLCKLIYLYHPLGLKMVDSPVKMAQSQPRDITIPDSPEDAIKEAYMNEWEAIGADEIIANVMTIVRMYGVGSLVYGAEGIETNVPIDPMDLHKLNLYFNVLDPLNTAGSLVLNQDPNAPDFQKPLAVASSGKTYHPSRSCVLFNEKPIYIAYSTSAFGYVGRSVYQRALFPMKSFIKSMITDDMVTTKAGVLIAKMKQVGSIMDKMMASFQGIKRQLLKEAKTTNVLSISTEEDIETLNMQNTDTAMSTARKNILENIAVSADMPAKILNSETFAEGFGEGTEDAKNVARYIETVRNAMQPLYKFFDKIVQYRAWNPEFYKTIQSRFPEYESINYNEALFQWINSFKAVWPSLLIEPESEQSKTEKVKLDAIVLMIEKLMPNLDPENKAILIEWAADNFNEQKILFPNPLILNFEALKNYNPDPVNNESGDDDLGLKAA